MPANTLVRNKIPTEKRVKAHVLAKEGLNGAQISQQTGLANSSVHRILNEDTSQYIDLVEAQRSKRLNQWAETVDECLEIAKDCRDLLKRAVSTAKNAMTREERDDALAEVQKLKDAGIDAARIINQAAIAQDKQNLLAGDPTSRTETTGHLEHIHSLSESEKRKRVHVLASNIADLDKLLDSPKTAPNTPTDAIPENASNSRGEL